MYKNYSDFRSHTNSLFIKLKVSEVREIIKVQQLKLLYEFLDNSLPADLKYMFKLKGDIHQHQTRPPFHIPAVNSSTYGINSIRYSGPKLYYDTFKNNGTAIGKDVKNIVRFDKIHSIFQFKGVLKKHFLYSYALQ